MMKRAIRPIVFILILAASYEVAFRICTWRTGQINTGEEPGALVFANDPEFLGHPVAHFFNWRAQLRLGKTRISQPAGVYVNGGRFYKKDSDGEWQPVTVTRLKPKRRR